MDTYWNVPCLFLRQWGPQSKHITVWSSSVVSLCHISPHYLSLKTATTLYIQPITHDTSKYSNWSNTLWKHYDVQYAMNDADKQRMMPFLSNTFLKNFIYTWIKSKALNNKEDRNLSSLQNKLSTNQPQPIHGLQTYLSTKCTLLKNILLLSQYHNLNNSITISFF